MSKDACPSLKLPTSLKIRNRRFVVLQQNFIFHAIAQQTRLQNVICTQLCLKRTDVKRVGETDLCELKTQLLETLRIGKVRNRNTQQPHRTVGLDMRP